jgi:hypothetical protein
MAVEPLPHLTPYRQLLAVAELRALLLATLLSRLAGRMFALAIVLYGVTQVHSPVLAGCTWVGHQSDRGIADRRVGSAWAFALAGLGLVGGATALVTPQVLGMSAIRACLANTLALSAGAAREYISLVVDHQIIPL